MRQVKKSACSKKEGVDFTPILARTMRNRLYPGMIAIANDPGTLESIGKALLIEPAEKCEPSGFVLTRPWLEKPSPTISQTNLKNGAIPVVQIGKIRD